MRPDPRLTLPIVAPSALELPLLTGLAAAAEPRVALVNREDLGWTL